MGSYLCHTQSVPILKHRLGNDIVVEGIPYGEVREINGVRFSFHPAGHVTGSAQVRVEHKGEVWGGEWRLQDHGRWYHPAVRTREVQHVHYRVYVRFARVYLGVAEHHLQRDQ